MIKIRNCSGDNTQTLEVEGDHPDGVWFALGDWAKAASCDIWQARMVYRESDDKYEIIAYYTER